MKDLSVGSVLKTVRQRQLLVEGVAGVCWAVVLSAALLLLAMWLDLLWDLSPQTRIGAALAASGIGLLALAWLVWHSWSNAQEANAARRVDQAGGFGGAVLSGWELASQATSSTNPGELRDGLSKLAIERAASLGATVAPSQAVPAKPARRAAGVLASVAGFALLLGVCLPTLAMTQWRRFVSPYDDVPPFSRTTFEVSPGDAKVIYGQGLEVRVEVSGEPTDHLALILQSGDKTEELPMFPEGENAWRASLARVTEPGTYFVTSESARSQRYNLEVITVPRIESVRFRITPPPYTREAIYQGPLPPEGLFGLAGAEVMVWAKSNRPLSGGRLDVATEAGATPIDLSPIGPGESEVTGTFAISSDGKFELRVADSDGQESLEAFSGAITLLKDQRPFIRLLRPQEMSLATPNVSLPIEVAAEDDYGVSRVQLYRSLNNSRPLPMDFVIGEDPPRRLQQQVYLPLFKYGLNPGDEIKLFARVEDNDPAGAKGAESTVALVRIISQEEFERMVRQRQGVEALTSKYQQAARRMEKIAEEIKKLKDQLAKQSPNSPVSEELKDKLEKLAQQMRRESEAIEKAAKHPLPYDLDENLTEQLKKLAESLKQAADDAEKLAADGKLSNGKAESELDRMAQQIGDNRNQFEQQATLPLELLQKVMPLLENESKFKMLVRRQRDLADRMAAFEGKQAVDDPATKARMRDLEREQKQVREQLDELLTDIETQVDLLPDLPELQNLRDTALDFAASVRESGADQAMTDCESALLEFAGDKAHAKAAEAADILASFLKKCEGMGGQCRGGLAFNPTLGGGLGNTVNQLLAASGLGQGAGGSGMGAGGQGGYSAQRGAGNSMGLYGGLPATGGAGSGFGQSNSNARGGAHSLPVAGSDGRPVAVRARSTLDATGGRQQQAPLRYRERVGRYFQRIAEELEEP